MFSCQVLVGVQEGREVEAGRCRGAVPSFHLKSMTIVSESYEHIENM